MKYLFLLLLSRPLYYLFNCKGWKDAIYLFLRSFSVPFFVVSWLLWLPFSFPKQIKESYGVLSLERTEDWQMSGFLVGVVTLAVGVIILVCWLFT